MCRSVESGGLYVAMKWPDILIMLGGGGQKSEVTVGRSGPQIPINCFSGEDRVQLSRVRRDLFDLSVIDLLY